MYQINLKKYNTFTTKSPSSLKLLQKKKSQCECETKFSYGRFFSSPHWLFLQYNFLMLI